MGRGKKKKMKKENDSGKSEVKEVAALPAAASWTKIAAKRARLRCSALDDLIRRIDAQARQPLPAQEQDRLAALRKDARSEQFRLPCR